MKNFLLAAVLVGSAGLLYDNLKSEQTVKPSAALLYEELNGDDSDDNLENKESGGPKFTMEDIDEILERLEK